MVDERDQHLYILHNKAVCLKCGDEIESLYPDDIKTCSCGNVWVEGGKDYIHHRYLESSQYLDESEFYNLD